MSANNFATYQHHLAAAGAAMADAVEAAPDVCTLGDVVYDLAKVLRKRLEPTERLIVASGAMQSLDPGSRELMIREAERGRKADAVFSGAWRHG